MKIEDYDSECDVTNPTDIEAALRKRHDGGINSFWLSHGASKFPAIGILVKGDLLTFIIFLELGDPGFRVGREGSWLETSIETSIFFCDPD